jgi:hypothetical protein
MVRLLAFVVLDVLLDVMGLLERFDLMRLFAVRSPRTSAHHEHALHVQGLLERKDTHRP